MDTILSEIENRVLGCLVEKELTTPEYYPLSLNALTNACNQKSNRDPLMTLEDDDVMRALESLRFSQLVVISADGGRVAKYRHLLSEKLQLVPAELALLCELLLRGPQTVGELRARCERMHGFADVTVVEETLQELQERHPPLVTKLAKQPGRKEARFAHLFSGEPQISVADSSPPPEAARLRIMAENERISKLEEDVAGMRIEITELRLLLEEFRRQFE